MGKGMNTEERRLKTAFKGPESKKGSQNVKEAKERRRHHTGS